ncbi:hypothetical protein K492DRAFT_12180 [Lichtheimia hyalospora FSU 10163]|nr:hypothetical protein K492DRAFT_12180 [Lichtheimia hyalospora FSU 10163]
MPALDLKGCLEDSPKFRRRVNAHEETIQHFESSLKVLLKLSRSQVNLYEVCDSKNWRWDSFHSANLKMTRSLLMHSKSLASLYSKWRNAEICLMHTSKPLLSNHWKSS